MRTTTLFTLLVLVAGILVAYNCLFVVRQIDRAVLLTFGEVTTSDIAPGLHFKFPVVHQVRLFDARIQTLDLDTESYLTAEKNYLEVDSYAKWRISDTAKYYTRFAGNEAEADRLLSQRINTGLRNQFGVRSVHDVVSGERDVLMVDLTRSLNVQTQDELGIEVVDIRVKKIDLPDNVSESVFQRMRTEREEEAQELRSTGREIAEGIRADADRQKIVIEAEAYRDAELIRGEGDALSTAIYASAYNKDPEFYEFSRSLNAYRDTFSNSSDLLLLGPDNDFLKYLKNMNPQQ